MYTAFLTALLVTATYQPLLHVLQTFFERWFYPSRYDYQKTLREVSREVASVIQLDQLVNLVVRVFGRTIGVSETSLLLLHRSTNRFQSVSPELVQETQLYRFIEMPESSAVVLWLREKREPLFKDEIRAKLERAELEGNRRLIWELSQVRQELERIGSDNWVPIFFKEELRAILVLGYKLSGDIYTAEDVDLIITLANQLAVALENTQLYQEILSLKDYNENVFHSLANGVLTTDRDARLVTLNRSAEHLLGVLLADVRGKTVDEIWGESHPLISHVHAALRGREQVGVEVGWRRPDQTFVPALLSSRPLVSRRKPIGTLLIMQDRTEVVTLEDRIRRADKLAAIGTMAAGMAHEIKNPLASMKVLIQLLPKKIDEKGFRQKLHSILPKEISRIDRIVEGLLSFARTSAPRRARIDINALLKETVEEGRDQAEASHVRMVDQLSEVPQIEADVLQIQQVFSNLMRNGIEAMPEGGVLQVQSQLVPSQNGSAPTVRISISDTGPGISADHVVKLFDPFFTTKHSGTGLGLAISHSIIQSHGGSIDVQSEPGSGSHFIIRLPVAVNEEKNE